MSTVIGNPVHVHDSADSSPMSVAVEIAGEVGRVSDWPPVVTGRARLRAARLHYGWTLAQAGAILGLSGETVRAWERGTVARGADVRGILRAYFRAAEG